MRNGIVAFVLSIAPILIGANCASAQQVVALKSNESTELFAVYWVSKSCQSALKSFGGVDVLEGPREVSISLKEGMVYARRQNCPKPIKGATVMLKSGEIKSKSESTLKFRVRYKTRDGDRQSVHSVSLQLYP